MKTAEALLQLDRIGGKLDWWRVKRDRQAQRLGQSREVACERRSFCGPQVIEDVGKVTRKSVEPNHKARDAF